MGQQRFVRKNMAFYDAQRRQENKKTRRKVFYTFLLIFISLVFLAVCVAVFLNVKTITVNGSERYGYDEIMEYVPISEGDNIFSFEADAIEENIKRSLAYIGDVQIKRDLPTTVEVNIVEEKPYFAANLAGHTYLISSKLKVLEKVDAETAESLELAELSFKSVRRCIVGREMEFVDERTLDALLMLYESFETNYIETKINSVDIQSRFDIYINYDDRFDVYLGDTENIDIKIRFLVSIIDELDADAKGKIDVSNHREASVALS